MRLSSGMAVPFAASILALVGACGGGDPDETGTCVVSDSCQACGLEDSTGVDDCSRSDPITRAACEENLLGDFATASCNSRGYDERCCFTGDDGFGGTFARSGQCADIPQQKACGTDDPSSPESACSRCLRLCGDNCTSCEASCQAGL